MKTSMVEPKITTAKGTRSSGICISIEFHLIAGIVISNRGAWRHLQIESVEAEPSYRACARAISDRSHMPLKDLGRYLERLFSHR